MCTFLIWQSCKITHSSKTTSFSIIAPLDRILFLTVPSIIQPLETNEFSTSAVSLKKLMECLLLL